jgi:hypothetical protein
VRARPVAASGDLRNQPLHRSWRVDRGQRFGSRNRQKSVRLIGDCRKSAEAFRISQVSERLNGEQLRSEMRMLGLLANVLAQLQAVRQRDQALRGGAFEHAARVDPQPEEFPAVFAAQPRCCRDGSAPGHCVAQQRPPVSDDAGSASVMQTPPQTQLERVRQQQ